jgi:hypothetical protein
MPIPFPAVISRPASLLKASGTAGVEVFVNGRSLASQKLAFPWLGGESAAGGQQPALHAYIGTLVTFSLTFLLFFLHLFPIPCSAILPPALPAAMASRLPLFD